MVILLEVVEETVTLCGAAVGTEQGEREIIIGSGIVK